MSLQQAEVANRLLKRLDASDFEAMAPLLGSMPYPRSMVLAEPDVAMPHAHFLDEGILSVVATSPEEQQAEAGLIGREGFIHPAPALGTHRTPQLIQVQVQGWAIASPPRPSSNWSRPTLRSLPLLFVQTLLVQSSCTSLANAVHSIDERLARWLLRVHDRSSSDDLPLTHGFMSTMLCVRRPSVTTAIHVLTGHKFIEADRGFVTIRDRAALEEFAGDSYGQPEAEYRRLLGPL